MPIFALTLGERTNVPAVKAHQVGIETMLLHHAGLATEQSIHRLQPWRRRYSEPMIGMALAIMLESALCIKAFFFSFLMVSAGLAPSAAEVARGMFFVERQFCFYLILIHLLSGRGTINSLGSGDIVYMYLLSQCQRLILRRKRQS
ncbi:MAG: hypothetical protein ACLRWQ_03555 [Flavonifractor plautii]